MELRRHLPGLQSARPGSYRRFARIALTAAVSAVFGAAAAAADQNDTSVPAAPNSEATNLEPITVTGSLIARRDYEAESPISTVSSAAITAAGQPSLDRAIGEVPQFEAAQGAAEVGDVQGGVGFGGGAAYSDLRGIGRNRSLVLMDGRRLMPSTPDGSIDLNTIPMSMIDSVEVITGGASATYGSDAMAGVANFKLKKQFSGVELNVEHGASTKGDAGVTQISGILGGKIDDGRGNMLLALEFSKRDEVMGSDRSFFTQPSVRFLGRTPEGMIYHGGFGAGATGPTIAAVNGVLAAYPGTTPYAGTGIYKGAIGVNTDGSIYTTVVPGSLGCSQNYKGVGSVVGAQISPSCTQAGVVLGNYFAVQVPLTKYNALTKADYTLSDHVTAYTQFNFSHSSSLDTTSPGSTKTNNTIELYVPVSNPYVQSNPALLSLINSAYGGTAPAGATVGYSKLMYGWGNRVQTFDYDVWQGLLGFKGDIPGTKLRYDVYATYGRSAYASQANGDISQTAINNVLANENVGGCNYNPFGLQPVSAACLAYAGRTENTTDAMTAKNVQLIVQGPLFTLPAGDASFAVGGDYRQSEFAYQPDSMFITGDTLSYGSATPASGSQGARELFGELLVPLVADKIGAKELDLDLGYRFSKYDIFSSKSTWKADALWTVTDGIGFRGGYSTSFRAPSLADLNVGNSVGQQSLNGGDPCDVRSSYRTGPNAAQVQALCAAQAASAGSSTYSYGGANVTVPVQTGGNRLLKPETGKSWSIGTVLTPAKGLNLSIDYYDMTISGAISSLSSGQILANCYGSTANPGFSASNAYCARIARDPSSGQISLLTSGLFNYSEFRLSGIDFQVDYKFDLDRLGLQPGSGALALGSVIAYLKEYSVTPSDGSAPTKYAGAISDTFVTSDGENLYSHPHWKANSFVSYSNAPFTGTLRWRYIGGMANLDDPTQPVPSMSYFDTDLHYAVSSKLTLSAGVNNLLDRSPPFIGTLELRTDAATYDVIGRTWYVSAKVKL